jgi:cytochrome c oxidase subunit 2
VLWTAIPIGIVLGLFVGTLGTLAVLERTAPATEVRVEAYRWGWAFSFPGTNVRISGTADTGPEVVLPVGQPIRIVLASADVIHAFYVPAFLFKRDAIPGRESSFEFTIAEAGTYRGQCAEFCGILHSRMPFALRAVPPPAFEAWLAAAAAAPAASASPGAPGP